MQEKFKTNGGELGTIEFQILEEVKMEIAGMSGFCEVTVGKPKRTAVQNRTIHALFTDLSVELEGLGVPLDFGRGQHASWTPITAKEIFFKNLYLAGKNTSECTTDELAKAVDILIRDINIRGGQLSIKSPLRGKKTLSVNNVKKLLK